MPHPECAARGAKPWIAIALAVLLGSAGPGAANPATDLVFSTGVL